jgi:hypothetical protein
VAAKFGAYALPCDVTELDVDSGDAMGRACGCSMPTSEVLAEEYPGPAPAPGVGNAPAVEE